jgi:hypothetical protein
VVETARSVNGLPIRLTDERWVHIIEEHSELAGMRLDVLDAIVNPSRILMGGAGELLAVREMPFSRHLIVVYRELQQDGFIITAFITSKVRSLDRRTQLWPKL